MVIDNTIIAAIITSIFAIIAAVIGALIQRRPISVNDTDNKKYLSKLYFLNRSYFILERKRDGRVVAIPNGISVFAGIFHILWAMFNGLWGFLLTVSVVFLIFFINSWAMCIFGKICFIYNVMDRIIPIAQSSILVFLFFYGNRLVIHKMTSSTNLLSTSQYEKVAVLYAKNKNLAVERYADTRGI